MVKKTNLSILLEKGTTKTKNECDQIIKIINTQLKSIFNYSQSWSSIFKLNYLKQLHVDYLRYAPFTSHDVPELQAKN
ncbi:unnamed protein product [Rotaria socialis]|uniref:Uncharacterized protein n=2 Tax=Rotaria socialis TaxID=392032 RepID=A0A817RVN1_9BILA|nr:unnamed protein product [Rotaria socialis]CAF3399026.1 unnamed protein product [Rotaria socialis]CAF3779062.1 unnamed protein product [Rotaria socialis]CAF3782821.1 unnamed protein product [Rotaria socialis]